MTSKHVLMHQCDHCKKMWRNKNKAVQHERVCIKNAERACGMCERDARTQAPLATLVAFIDENGMDTTGLRELSGGCPMCMLAAVYQVNMATDARRNSDEWMWFDYAEELRIHDKDTINDVDMMPF